MKPSFPLSGFVARLAFTRLERVLLVLIALGLAVSLTLHAVCRSPFVDLVADNARWTFEILAGLLVLVLRRRSSQGEHAGTAGGAPSPRSFSWFIVGAAGYAAGQLVWVFGLLTGTLHFPGLSDLFFPLLPLSLLIALAPALDIGLEGKKRRAVWLDMTGLGLMAATLIVALYLPNRGIWGNGTLFVVGLYPVLFLTAFGMIGLIVLVRRIDIAGSPLLALLGMGGLSFTWLKWNLDFLQGVPTTGGLLSYLFSLSHTLLFYGLATVRGRIVTKGPYVRWLDRLHRLLPLLFVLAAGVGVVYGARRFEAEGERSIVGIAVYIGSAAMVLCAMFRQIVLLYEQDQELAAEYRLRERDIAFRAVFENSSDLLFSLRVEAGGDFRYTAINPSGAAMGDIEVERFIGSRPRDYFPGEKGLRFEANYRRCVAAGQPVTYEQTAKSSSGSIVFETTLVPVLDAGGAVVQIVGISRNITAQKSTLEAMRSLNTQLEQRIGERTEELEAAYREMEAFSYSVSHDLRNPLRGINGFCRALIEDYGSLLPAEGHRYLDRVQDASRRMGQIIDDLLALSRISRCAIAQTDEVDLSAIAVRISDTLRASSPGRAATATFSISLGLLARCDRRLIENVLENLLGNAWKYTGRHPTARIEFGSLLQGGRPVYYVRDDGAGFDMRFRDKLFQNFQRLHSQAEFEGTGVGLAIVARIIKRHGGRIWAESAVEEGATFFFTLGEEPRPVVTSPAPAAPLP
ncbi:His Kinase A (phospho-acceptor) domain-containing protein [Verrucomicrobium sp. GAS474]|uniref:sensor histidine kinase n=1 Tax=Verrucomicrobium sp. GAS474 TaxID=1882831 RepID=UPI00087AC566|nr:ATP-binding protein [Verrucomicrobium sp. GAS474]SDT91764.1 His Kinase A (phospho-acceptor) domain-containing protein [Verrucomicrobium sp. GAS474]